MQTMLVIDGIYLIVGSRPNSSMGPMVHQLKTTVRLYLLYRGPYGFEYTLYNEIPSVHLNQAYNLAHYMTD